MLTLKELDSVIQLSGKSISEFSLSLGRSEKFIYVILNQYRGRPVIGQRVSALIFSKYPTQVKKIIGDDRSKVLQPIAKEIKKKKASVAGRKPGQKTTYAAKVATLKAELKKNRPELLKKLSAEDLKFIASVK